MRIFTEDQLKKQVPSVFSTEGHEKTSAKYSLIPTIDCVRGLQQAGFCVVDARETRCRLSDNKPFAKHMLRFRKEGLVTAGKGEYLPEIVMINSHDGTCSYQLKAGIYRLICTNGLIVGNDFFHRSIRHKGDVIEDVVRSAGEIIEIIPEAVETIKEWKTISLNDSIRNLYAESAAMLKWDKEDSLIPPQKLLNPKRYVDNQNDLWTTFNVLQENLIKGGVRYFNPNTERRGSTRSVSSVSENARLNMCLWNLTEKMAQLAK